MIPPSDHTATPAGFRRNAWLASIGTGGWFASESMAGFAGIRTLPSVSRHIVRQRELVAEMERDGHDTIEARQLPDPLSP